MADAELDRWRKYQKEKQQLNKLILAERHAAEQAAAEALAAQQRRLAAEANAREVQRAAERREREASGGINLMAQANVMGAFEAGSWDVAPTAEYRGMGAADSDEAEDARYNACSAALSEALPDP